MTSLTSKIFSSSEYIRVQNLLKHPKEDLQEIIGLLERKVEAEYKKCKESETELKKTEQRFRSLIEQTTDAVFCYEYNPLIPINLPIDEQVKRLYEGFLVDCNLVCARSYGASQVEDVIGRKLTDLFGIAPNSLDKLFRDLIEGGYSITDGVGIEKLPNGEERYFLNNGHSVIENNKLVRVWGTFRDITSTKKAELELLKERKFTETALNTQRDTFFVFDPSTGKAIRWNKAFSDISGYSYEEIADLKAPDSYYNKIDLEKAIRTSKRVENEGTALLEMNLITKDGRTIPFEYMGSSINDEDGNLKYIVSIGRDIAEHKKVEQKLKESEEKYRNLFEKSPNAIALVDFTGKIVDCNSATENVFGYSAEDLIGRNYLELPFYSESMIISLKERFQAITKKADLKSHELEIKKKDGSNTRIKTDISFITVGDQNFFQAIIQDVTEQKNAEEKLKESEEKNRGLINNITDIIYELDINGKCTYVSNQLFAISGFHPEELLGQNLFKFLHTEDFSTIIEKVKEAFNSGTRISADFRLHHKDGHYVPVSSNFNVIRINDEQRFIGVLRDNTEKRKAELKLRESEEELRRLNNELETNLDIIPGMLFCKDRNDVVTRVNQNFADSLNLKKEEIIGKTSFDLFPLDQVEKFRKDDLEIYNSGLPKLNIEESADFSDGNIWALTNKTPYYNEQGEIIGIIGLAIDITDRKIVEQKLRESEENFRTIAEDSHLAITILQDDLVVYTNQKMADMFGYEREEMLTWTPKEYAKTVAEDSLEFIMEQARKKQIGDPDVITQYPIHCVKSSGEKFWVDNISTTIIYNGHPADLITIIDTTDKRKAEEKLKESEEKFRLLFEAIADPIHVIDADLKIIYMNPAFEKWLKSYNLYFDVIGKNPVEAWPHIGEEVNEEYKKVFETKIIHIKEDWTHINDIGIFTEARKIPIIKSGKVIQIITIVRDFSDRKKAELELIKLNNLKSELLRRTSHELKTPLVSIKGFSDLLLQVHRGKLDAFVISILNEIKQGCLRLENLIADILKTSELESGIIQLRKSEEDLSFLIRLCVNEIKGLSILRNHRINLEIPESFETMFEKEQVHQVVSNLLNNAVKYTPPGGLIEIKSEIKNEFIITSIKDNGIGISDEEKEIIFKQFGKVERYGQGLDIISEGSGLGLFISKKIIELHGGKIWVESEGKHKGSTFYFSLPLVKNS